MNFEEKEIELLEAQKKLSHMLAEFKVGFA
ncbi:hypothetical protein M2105_002794 [Paenibacillus sp. PastF-1]|nr:hypothetical protein [Paenibacillus sp. PastF-1]